MRPRPASTASTALMAASSLPVVADHVGVGVIHDDGVRIRLFDGLHDGVGNSFGGHFGLEVVRCTFGEGTRMRSSPVNGFSTPPLKK